MNIVKNLTNDYTRPRWDKYRWEYDAHKPIKIVEIKWKNF